MRFLFIIFVALVIGYQFGNAQTCDHESTRMSRFRADGFQPFVARNYDGSHLEWTYSDDRGTYAGTFSIDKRTKLPDNFAASYKGHLYWAIFSSCDQLAYIISDMSGEQLKEFKKLNPK